MGVFRPPAARLVARDRCRAAVRQRGGDRRPAAVHRPVRCLDVAHLSPRRHAVRAARGRLGGARAQSRAGVRRHEWRLGAAGRTARLRAARGGAVPCPRAAGGAPCVALVARRRLRGRAGAALEIHRGARAGRRLPLPADRARAPPLAAAPASLRGSAAGAGTVRPGRWPGTRRMAGRASGFRAGARPPSGCIPPARWSCWGARRSTCCPGSGSR